MIASAKAPYHFPAKGGFPLPMSDYVIFSDSSMDIAPEVYAKWGVQCIALNYRFQNEEAEYADGDGQLTTVDFYNRMRAGGVAKTAAVNTERFAEAFEPVLAAGQDLLYLGFSSGLSNTYNAGRIAVEQLREKYPDRKILAVDTLAASAGQGLLVYLTVLKKREGAAIEEAAKWAEKNRLHLCHWFTVDDLVYLKRGGRVSATAAFVGNILGIKPVLHVDNEGHLINMQKARGRRNALATMAEKYKQTALCPSSGHVFISHGDCRDDAVLLADMLREQCGAEVELITMIGPVIGAHSGPGTLALFFLGTER